MNGKVHLIVQFHFPSVQVVLAIVFIQPSFVFKCSNELREMEIPYLRVARFSTELTTVYQFVIESSL